MHQRQKACWGTPQTQNQEGEVLEIRYIKRERVRERERKFELSNFNTRIVALEQPDFVRDKIR